LLVVVAVALDGAVVAVLVAYDAQLMLLVAAVVCRAL
jgi:hypothetical protein